MLKYLVALVVVLGLAFVVARQDQHAADQTAQIAAQTHKAAVATNPNEQHPQEHIDNPAGNGPRWYIVCLYSLFRWPNGTTTWAIILTLWAIAEQAKESAKATQAMRDSVGLERIKLKQWVVLQNWSCSRSVFHNGTPGLEIQFELVNRTAFPVTFLRAVTRVGQIESHSFGKHSMPPNEPYEIAVSVSLTPEQDRDYLASMIILSVRGQISFVGIEKIPEQQYFGGLLSCGTRAGIRFRPHSAFEEYARDDNEAKENPN